MPPKTITAPRDLLTLTEKQWQRLVTDTADLFGWMVSEFNYPSPPLPNGTVLVDVVIDGQPLPKERPRFSEGRAYTPPKTKDIQEAIGYEVKTAMERETDEEHELAVDIGFFRKSRSRVDIDNLIKTVLDSCNGVVWRDDSQITQLTAHLSHWADQPRTHLRVWVIGSRSVGTCVRCGDPIRMVVGSGEDHRARRNPEKRFCSEYCYHNRNNPFSPDERSMGFPDLILIRGGKVIFAELKTERGKVSDAQYDWHSRAMEHGAEVDLWRPSDWKHVVSVLGEGRDVEAW